MTRMRKSNIYRIILLLLALVLLTTACSLPAAEGKPQAVSQLILTPDPNASPTPTPFQPVPGPDASFTPAENAGDAPSQAAATPTEVPLIDRLPRPDGQVNILILGSDFRPDMGFRTDTIVLVSLNPKKGTASMVSFPRDLWVTIPGWMEQRINTAQAHGGFALTQATFELNFGVHVDHYIMTNFNGFVNIINSLGGITVNASRQLSDRCDLPQAVNHYCTVGPGPVEMNGQTALWYVRSRYSSSDFDRTRRAQEVLLGIFTKLMSLNGIQQAPQLYNEFRSSVETDMSLSDMLPLVPLASKMIQNPNMVNRYEIGPDLVTPFVTAQGADVLLPHTEAIWEIIKKACYDQ